MKKNYYLFFAALAILALTNAPAIGQVDPAQEVIVIEGGVDNIGQLELTINRDTVDGGGRANPNRIYQLQKDQVYIQQSAIVFQDTEATLRIHGEEGGNMPIVLMDPPEDVDQFTNEVFGDLELKHVYWPAMNLKNMGGALFVLRGSSTRLELDHFITENARSDVFNLTPITGYANVFIKNSYFRDLSQLSNSWNYVVFTRGNNGEPFDTLWIENTTISNAGMPLFGKGTVTEFLYINHVTFYNSTKYPIWMERFGEAYFTNNLFLNANWEGECQSTWETQIGEDFDPAGQIRFDTVEADFWAPTPDGVGSAPDQADVKILASNNLNFFSPLLDGYYSGEYNDQFDKPMSNRPWSPAVGADGIPIPVTNVPVPLFGERELQLIADWDGIKADNNYDLDTDPDMNTKSPADAAAAEEFVKFARANYQVAAEGAVEHDRTKIWFGDGDATTVPGNNTEDGGGMPDVSGMPEDFRYANSAIRSKIDGYPLGDLSWWPNYIDDFDSEAFFAQVKAYYVDPVPADPVGISKNVLADKGVAIYPNPAKGVLNIKGQNELEYVRFYNVIGSMVKEVALNGALDKQMDISGLENGMYILQVKEFKGETRSIKFMKQ